MLQVEILCWSYVIQPNVYMGDTYITFCYVRKHSTKWLVWNGMVSSYDFELYVDIRVCGTNWYQLMWYHVVPHGTILIDCGTMWYGMIIWCALFPRTIWPCSLGDLHTNYCCTTWYHSNLYQLVQSGMVVWFQLHTTHVVPHGTTVITVICTSWYNGYGMIILQWYQPTRTSCSNWYYRLWYHVVHGGITCMITVFSYDFDPVP
jgi:hypothetical protein